MKYLELLLEYDEKYGVIHSKAIKNDGGHLNE